MPQEVPMKALLVAVLLMFPALALAQAPLCASRADVDRILAQHQLTLVAVLPGTEQPTAELYRNAEGRWILIFELDGQWCAGPEGVGYSTTRTAPAPTPAPTTPAPTTKPSAGGPPL